MAQINEKKQNPTLVNSGTDNSFDYSYRRGERKLLRALPISGTVIIIPIA